MHHHRGVRIGLALALVLAANGFAESAAVDQARETLQRMRELRKAREARDAAPQPLAWGHFLKKPPEEDRLLTPAKVEVKKPELNPTGTIRMGKEIRVVVGTATYAVGDEILPGYKVRAITERQLTIFGGENEFKYPIR